MSPAPRAAHHRPPVALLVLAVVLTALGADRFWTEHVPARSSRPVATVQTAAPAPTALVSSPVPTEAGRSTPRRRPAADPRALPAQTGHGKRVVYSKHLQRVWLVGATEGVVRTYRVSGELSQPDPGRYAVYSKSRWTTSSISDERMQYMVRFTHGKRTGTPVGFHDIPQHGDGRNSQTVAQLGQPRSHGCIRQARPDAMALWAFTPVGTPVMVVA